MPKAAVSLLLLLLLPTFAAADDPARKRAIEQHLATAVAIEGVQGKSLEARMKEVGVPALSYAVIDRGRIVLAAAYGLADVNEARPATTSTMFQAASISKPVSAMGVMDLVERGKLSLDVPVNSLLRSWQLPENALTAATPVTLRHLLSHSGGTTVHGFPGYALDEARPTLLQVLNGQPPSNTAPIVVDLAPNTKFRYSGGGTTIVQAVVIDQTGLTFPEFMRRTVLQPLGMTGSSYEQPLPPSRRGMAATAYRFGGRAVEGKWHVYPEIAAAGLWTTPSDLAKVVIEMQDALAGRPARLLTIDAARHMVTKRFEESGIGLGFFVEEHDGHAYFSHGGSNEGFRASLLGSVDGSRGLVVMANSDSSDAMLDDVITTIARAYDWPGYQATPLKAVAVTDAVASRFVGRYELESKDVVSIRRDANGLEILDVVFGWTPLYALADGTLTRADRDNRYSIAAEGLTVTREASSRSPKAFAAKRLAEDAAVTGEELFGAGRVEEGAAAFRERFRKDPASVVAADMIETGTYFLYVGRIDDAVALLRLSTELYPTVARTHANLAEALIAAGQTDRAIAALEETLRRLDADSSAAPDVKERLRRRAEWRLKRLRR